MWFSTIRNNCVFYRFPDKFPHLFFHCLFIYFGSRFAIILGALPYDFLYFFGIDSCIELLLHFYWFWSQSGSKIAPAPPISHQKSVLSRRGSFRGPLRSRWFLSGTSWAPCCSLPVHFCLHFGPMDVSHIPESWVWGPCVSKSDTTSFEHCSLAVTMTQCFNSWDWNRTRARVARASLLYKWNPGSGAHLETCAPHRATRRPGHPKSSIFKIRIFLYWFFDAPERHRFLRIARKRHKTP